MWRIHSPNKEYAGVTAGVTFVGGVGETTDEPSDYFQRHGYTVEELESAEPDDQPDAKPTKKKTTAKDGE